jgi:hypothetical protein
VNPTTAQTERGRTMPEITDWIADLTDAICEQYERK